jgi:hypothetical protein
MSVAFLLVKKLTRDCFCREHAAKMSETQIPKIGRVMLIKILKRVRENLCETKTTRFDGARTQKK